MPYVHGRAEIQWKSKTKIPESVNVPELIAHVKEMSKIKDGHAFIAMKPRTGELNVNECHYQMKGK